LIIPSDRFLVDLALTIPQALPQPADRSRHVGLAAPEKLGKLGVAGNSPLE